MVQQIKPKNLNLMASHFLSPYTCTFVKEIVLTGTYKQLGMS